MIQNVSIDHHTISGFGGFTEETVFIMPNKGATLLLGINGAGKTTVLNSIYYSLSNLISGFVPLRPKEIGISQSAVSIKRDKAEVFTYLSINDEIPANEIGYRLLKNGQVQIIGKDSNRIRKEFKDLFMDGILPLFRYFQSQKTIDNSTVTSIIYNKIEDRNTGYNQHYSKSILIQEVTSFLINQINIENQEKVDKNDFSVETPIGIYVRRTLRDFSSALYDGIVDVKVGESKYSTGQSIILTKNNKSFEFLQLSSGEQYVFSIVLELIFRIVTLNPNNPDFRATPGIVLIDEIEDHLHPKWQLTIIGALEMCFPNIQFIISTHSPLIASSVRNSNILPLSDFKVIPIEEIPNVYSGTADELLEKVLLSDVQISNFSTEKDEIYK
ncbi:MAG: hypothetical protein DRI97_11525, partial [Bacteroidetes bacterium]